MSMYKLLFCNFRDYFPVLAPDGRPFPLSLTQSRGPVTFPLPLPIHCTKDDDATGTEGQAKGKFPHNVEFIHVSATLRVVHVIAIFYISLSLSE